MTHGTGKLNFHSINSHRCFQSILALILLIVSGCTEHQSETKPEYLEKTIYGYNDRHYEIGIKIPQRYLQSSRRFAQYTKTVYFYFDFDTLEATTGRTSDSQDKAIEVGITHNIWKSNDDYSTDKIKIHLTKVREFGNQLQLYKRFTCGLKEYDAQKFEMLGCRSVSSADRFFPVNAKQTKVIWITCIKSCIATAFYKKVGIKITFNRELLNEWEHIVNKTFSLLDTFVSVKKGKVEK
ncbi:hypothetical protein [Oleiphilus messinensis]|nr:hypothetical protein [Oleiphilus messinensis]